MVPRAFGGKIFRGILRAAGFTVFLITGLILIFLVFRAASALRAAGFGFLRPGDVIVTITGQGRSVYRVAALGGSQQVRIEDPEPNRLLLVTASSPVVPSYYVEVDARLVSGHPARGPVVRVINAPELALAGDDGHWCSPSSGASRWQVFGSPRDPRTTDYVNGRFG